MSLRLSRALGGCITIAVATALLSVTPAQAREAKAEAAAPLRPVFVAATAKGPNHFNSSATVDVPGGGSAQVSSPSLDNNMTAAKVTVSAPLSDQPGFAKMAMVMFQLPTPGKRLAACMTMTPKYLDNVIDEANESMEDLIADESRKTLAFFLYCVRLAQLVAAVLADPANARLAAAACPALPLGVKVKTEKVNGLYRITTDGPLTLKKKNSNLKVKCVVQGGSYVYTVKPRKRGVSLKSVVGKNLSVGVASPAGAEGAKVTVAFKAL
jgi:hypothetical protein